MLGHRLMLDAAMHPHRVFREEDFLTERAIDRWLRRGCRSESRSFFQQDGLQARSLLLQVGNGPGVSGDVRRRLSSAGNFGEHLLQGVLHCPAWHGCAGAFPDISCRNVSQMSRDAEDCSKVLCKNRSQGVKGASGNTDNMLCMKSAGANACLPEP